MNEEASRSNTDPWFPAAATAAVAGLREHPLPMAWWAACLRAGCQAMCVRQGCGGVGGWAASAGACYALSGFCGGRLVVGGVVAVLTKLSLAFVAGLREHPWVRLGGLL